MANENETIQDIASEMSALAAKVDVWDGNVETSYIREFADRILAAHKREIAAKGDERLTVVANYESVIAAKDRIIAAKDAEISSLRALVKELSDALSQSVINHCYRCKFFRLKHTECKDKKNEVKCWSKSFKVIIEKAREVCK